MEKIGNKISVITVVFNDVTHIRETMESFFSQTWEEKEYIVIDGGSTDGTVDIIREYGDKLAFWCSEKDEGIYDAMNKGISHATGNWINFLNSGDVFTNASSLSHLMNDCSLADIVYGNSVEINQDHIIAVEASDIDMAHLWLRVLFNGNFSLTSLKKRNMAILWIGYAFSTCIRRATLSKKFLITFSPIAEMALLTIHFNPYTIYIK